MHYRFKKLFIDLIVCAAVAIGLIANASGQSQKITPKKLGATLINQSEISTLSGSFARTFEGEVHLDSTCGEFYYLGSDKMLIDVHYPLHQSMMIEGNITTIYYPELEKAFRLESMP